MLKTVTRGRRRMRQEARETLGLAIPVVIGQLSYMGMQVVDVAMVGRYGSTELGGMALGANISTIGILIALGIVSAIAPQVSHAEGAGDKPACGRALGEGLWIALALAIGWMLVMQHADALLIATGQQPELAAIAQAYVTTLSLGYPAALGFGALRQFVEGLSLTRPAMIIALAGLPLNAALNLIFMYGYFGLPAMGVAGTGLATALVQYVGFIALAAFVGRSQRFRAYEVDRVFRVPSLHGVLQFLALGLPLGVSIGMEVGVFGGTTLMMGWFGPIPTAAHQIVLNLASITFMVPLGISIAGSIRVGQARGRSDLPAVTWAGWLTFALAGVFMSLSALILVTFRRTLLGIYTGDAAVLEVAFSLLGVAATFQIFDGLQVAGVGVLRGLKDTRAPMFATTLAFWGIGMPVAYGLAVKQGWGPIGLWWGLTAGLFAAGLCHIFRFRYLVRHDRYDPTGREVAVR